MDNIRPGNLKLGIYEQGTNKVLGVEFDDLNDTDHNGIPKHYIRECRIDSDGNTSQVGNIPTFSNGEKWGLTKLLARCMMFVMNDGNKFAEGSSMFITSINSDSSKDVLAMVKTATGHIAKHGSWDSGGTLGNNNFESGDSTIIANAKSDIPGP